PASNCRTSDALQRIKNGVLRFFAPRGYLEIMKRAIRRSGLDAVYTKGFSPTMKLSMSPPPAFGIASICEYMQLDLKEEKDPQVILESLNRAMPEGSHAVSCIQGKIRQPEAFVYRTDRPFTIAEASDKTITKGDRVLPIADYLISHDADSLTIAVRDGRTLSPAAILDVLSPDNLQAWEITRVEMIFPAF
ncbi:DUF2344 domain-containing protein, partial [archaeon]|nr:DUF2344 domain-containing protein [archaeon]